MLTAAIALPLLILLISKGSFVLFASFIAIVAGLGLYEFYRMTIPGRPFETGIAVFAGMILSALFLFLNVSIILAALTFILLLIAVIILFHFRDIGRAAQEWALAASGIFYVPLMISQLIWLRAEPFGSSWVFLLMVIVMAGDSVAYYFGTAFGRHKLYPSVSPNKSIEGAIGGLVGSIAGAFIARFTFFPQLGIVDIITTALILGVLGQLGDLFESLLKRSCGVKDSGVIVPGHGGMLDRLDSILFAAPAAYWYAHFLFPLGGHV